MNNATNKTPVQTRLETLLMRAGYVACSVYAFSTGSIMVSFADEAQAKSLESFLVAAKWSAVKVMNPYDDDPEWTVCADAKEAA